MTKRIVKTVGYIMLTILGISALVEFIAVWCFHFPAYTDFGHGVLYLISLFYLAFAIFMITAFGLSAVIKKVQQWFKDLPE